MTIIKIKFFSLQVFIRYGFYLKIWSHVDKYEVHLISRILDWAKLTEEIYRVEK
jgi:hypothetical protein